MTPCKKYGHTNGRYKGGQCKTCTKKDNKIYHTNNKEECNVTRRAKYKANPEKYKAMYRKHRLKEGYGVYIATFPSGKYVGSGQLTSRRGKHTAGNSTIAKKLKEKSVDFKILLICYEHNCLMYEDAIIKCYGKENLLNTRRC